MWTTVNDVLELEAMQWAAVLAGHNGLGRQVKSVTVLDAPDATLWLRGNELALTSTFPLNKQYTNLNRLVPELVSRDVAGLGVKLSRYMKSLPQSMIDQANELAFPDRKSTRLNSSHVASSYAVFCLKKKKRRA